MTDNEIQSKILETFRQERKSPNADFDESHFLDYLTCPAQSRNTLKNSFRGAKKYYHFMNKLELEFGICFGLPDLDKYYSVDSLTQKIKERIEKPRGNIINLKNRIEYKNKYRFEITLIVILIAFYIWLGLHIVPIILTVIFGVAIYFTLSNRIYDIRHNKKLMVIINKYKQA